MTVGLIHTGHSERPSVKRTSVVRTYSSMLHVISLVNDSNYAYDDYIILRLLS